MILVSMLTINIVTNQTIAKESSEVKVVMKIHTLFLFVIILAFTLDTASNFSILNLPLVLLPLCWLKILYKLTCKYEQALRQNEFSWLHSDILWVGLPL